MQPGRRARWGGFAASAALLTACVVGSALAMREVLPPETGAAEGVRVAGQALGRGEDPAPTLARHAAELLDRPLTLSDGDEVLATTSLRALGARVDEERAARDALRVGREGPLASRVVQARSARRGEVEVHLLAELPVEPLVALVAEAKERLDKRPHAARRDVATGVVLPHEEGRWLDAFATVEAVLRAARDGQARVPVVFRAAHPAASTEVARSLDTGTELASFETRFGGPPGRDRNIQRASSALDGVILMPGEEVSFNDEVGPRSAENGFYPAPEIYRGESRLGIGGGVCQVASTVYAAVLFSGLEVIERRNHSRPSAYIRPGLDATVSYPVLDLRMRNPFDFPVLLDTQVEGGVMRARVLGKERRVEVELATETAGISKYKRKVERAGWLTAGTSKLKQRGKNGMSIRRTLRLRERGGPNQTLTSMDVYPPTQEIWLLAPGADPEEVLPPMEGAGQAPGPA